MQHQQGSAFYGHGHQGQAHMMVEHQQQQQNEQQLRRQADQLMGGGQSVVLHELSCDGSGDCIEVRVPVMEVPGVTAV